MAEIYEHTRPGRCSASRILWAWRKLKKSRSRTSSSPRIDVSQVEQIENKILIRELLETLKPLDREIFTRHMRGDTCPEIDADLGLKPRTAEIRFAFCKNALRKAFMDKLDRKNCARGC